MYGGRGRGGGGVKVGRELAGEGYLSGGAALRLGQSWTGCGRAPPGRKDEQQLACVSKKKKKVAGVSVRAERPRVSQAVSGGGGGRRGGGRRRGGVTLSVRLSVSSALPFRHVPVAVALPPPSPPSYQGGVYPNQAARDAMILSSRPPPTCCDADIKHQDIMMEGGGACGR